MLKKTVASEILPITRLCKCGKTVSIHPTDEKTHCDTCGELVYENVKVSSGDSKSDQTDSDEYLSNQQNSAPT